ncbi:hypothetical protein [Neokomagataea thailandica]|nr:MULTISPECIES: hypothetical protein [Neokomagataea]
MPVKTKFPNITGAEAPIFAIAPMAFPIFDRVNAITPSQYINS